MSTDVANGERDAELAQLQATMRELAASLGQVRAELAEVRATRAATPGPFTASGSKRDKPTPGAPSPPAPKGQPTSRRGLLKRLGASAAGAAAAATALGAMRPEQAAADYQGTSVGAGAGTVGLLAYPGNVTPPATFGFAFGVVGVSQSGAPTPGGGAGVWGTSDTHPGVVGTSNGDHGVHGYSTSTFSQDAGVCGHSTVTGASETNHGVLGAVGTFAGISVGAGVTGTSATKVGTQGTSTSNHGVFGRTSAPAGTIVNGMLAAGLAGRTGSTIALYGYSDGPPNPNYAPVGAVGQCQSGFGVWGLSSAGPGATSRPGGGAVTAISGVLGTSASGIGMYAISSGSYALAADGNGPSTVGALLRGLGGGKAAVCVGDVEIQGHLTVTGGINGPVTAQAGEAAATSLPLVEAVGRGQVERGTATVVLDPTVAAQVQGTDYDVFLTSYDNVQLHVASRTPQGFEVRVTDGTGRAADIAGGRATAAFSYRVVARRRPGAGSQRADAAPLHVPTIPVPQGVPTLPVGRETPPSAPTRKPGER
jgi:hypothetical protein